METIGVIGRNVSFLRKQHNNSSNVYYDLLLFSYSLLGLGNCIISSLSIVLVIGNPIVSIVILINQSKELISVLN